MKVMNLVMKKLNNKIIVSINILNYFIYYLKDIFDYSERSRLYNDYFINDNIIDKTFNLFRSLNSNYHFCEVVVGNLVLFNQNPKLKNQFRNKSLKAFDFTKPNLIPLNLNGNHWVLLHLECKKEEKLLTFTTINSLYNTIPTKLIENNFRTRIFKKYEEFNDFEYVFNDLDCCKQPNTFDCGMYLLSFALEIIEFKGLQFDYNNTIIISRDTLAKLTTENTITFECFKQ